jgi:hypothetical protein
LTVGIGALYKKQISMHFIICSTLLHLFLLQVMLEDDIPGQKRSAPIDFDGESQFFFSNIATK